MVVSYADQVRRIVSGAGFDGYLVKTCENKAAVRAGIPGYSVFVKKPGDRRGKCIGCFFFRSDDVVW